MFTDSLMMLTDSYKLTHFRQYPKGTESVYAYFESRDGAKFPYTCFFGLQYFMDRYLTNWPINHEAIDEAEEIVGLHLGAKSLFNRKGWENILYNHGGNLPIRIKAVPEGTCVPTGNVLMTIENTDPDAYWLTNYLETLLVETWYPCTVATQSREMKKVWMKYLQETGSDAPDFKLHDFGFRGVTCPEQAGIGGVAHLVNFKGTDTLAAIMLARQYYDCPMAGYSIPASEHSTITSWGCENEIEAMRNMLTAYPEVPIVACVSDSYNIWNACDNIWGKVLKDEIMSRKGTLVVRPDSGSPVETVVAVVKRLMVAFGYTRNDKGYHVLPPQVRVIQGDGVDFNSMKEILKALKERRLSADNLAMGSGGGLLQKLNRDTQRFAFKCSAACVDGEWRQVFKDPVTDNSKTSKKGRLKLVRLVGGHGATHATVAEKSPAFSHCDDMLETVYENGKIIKRHTLDEIRARAEVTSYELAVDRLMV